MKFITKNALLFCFSACLSSLNAVTLLNSFGTNDLTLFSTSGSFVASANSATFSGTGEGVFTSGDFTRSVNVSSIGSPGSLALNLNFNSTYTGKIDVVVGSFDSVTFESTSVSYTMNAENLSGLQTITFLRDANPAIGILNLTAINFVTITADNPNFTLNTLAALQAASPIPEPSTFAALGGAAVLGLAIMRRRRQAA